MVTSNVDGAKSAPGEPVILESELHHEASRKTENLCETSD